MMKLSEAIRLGGMATPQAQYCYINDLDQTCALGGAFLAAGVGKGVLHGFQDAKPDGIAWPVNAWAWTSQFIPVPAIAGLALYVGVELSVRYIISLLNDRAGWTREQIADWVATIEPADTPAETPVETLVPVEVAQ